MANPYVGEIRQWPGNFAPLNWAYCDGSLQSINDYPELFNLLGTTYGGDGQQTFGLPNLQGRVPIHQGGGLSLGQVGGAEQVTVTTNQLPAHNHTPMSSASGGGENPNGGIWAPASGGATPYAQAPGTASMSVSSVSIIGGNQPHENRIPYQVISYIISLYGIYPSQQ